MCKVEQRSIIKSVFLYNFKCFNKEIWQRFYHPGHCRDDGNYTATGMNAHIANPIDIKTILAVFDLVFGTS